MTPRITDERLSGLAEFYDYAGNKETASALRELQSLRALVAKLPQTADGVPVVECMEVFVPAIYYGKVLKMQVEAFGLVAISPDGGYPLCPIAKCYSTRELAEKAGAK